MRCGTIICVVRWRVLCSDKREEKPRVQRTRRFTCIATMMMLVKHVEILLTFGLSLTQIHMTGKFASMSIMKL